MRCEGVGSLFGSTLLSLDKSCWVLIEAKSNRGGCYGIGLLSGVGDTVHIRQLPELACEIESTSINSHDDWPNVYYVEPSTTLLRSMSSELFAEECSNYRCNELVDFLESRCPKCLTDLYWETQGYCECGTLVDFSRKQCYNCGRQLILWTVVCDKVREEFGPREDLAVSKEVLPNPKDLGWSPSVGAPKRQAADYRISYDDGTCVHIKEFDDHYQVHWDEKDPNQDLVGHFTTDAPLWGLALVGGAALAAKHYSKK